MTETEHIRFKILNRLAGFTLIINPVTNCWTKADNDLTHYGTIRFDKKQIALHFLSCILFHSLDIDKPNQLALHKCDIRACCNPSHLYVGSISDNVKDDKYRQKHHIPDGAILDRPKPQSNPEHDLEFISDTIQ